MVGNQTETIVGTPKGLQVKPKGLQVGNQTGTIRESFCNHFGDHWVPYVILWKPFGVLRGCLETFVGYIWKPFWTLLGAKVAANLKAYRMAAKLVLFWKTFEIHLWPAGSHLGPSGNKN